MAFQCKRCLSSIIKKEKGNYCPHCKEYKSDLQIEEAPEIEEYEEYEED
jgi:Zn finger protein HypA/HybF involved in hydrogenase expression